MELLKGFDRGVNFGGWLSQCDHTKERYDNFITEKDFCDVKDLAFDHVRIPVDYELILNDDHTFNDNFSYLDLAIDMCKKYSLNMVLDLHRTPGYSFDPFHGEKGFFENDQYQEIFFTIWEKFAERYGKYSDFLIFELLNEVTKKEYSEKWNEISLKCFKRIRKYAPDTRIILGGYYNNSLEAIKDLPYPYDDKIIYTFHCYEPLLFTHQGAYWIETMDTSFRCDYKMPFSDYEKYSEKYLCQAHSSFKDFDPNACPDESFFESLLSEALTVAKDRNVPLYCGEFGVIDRADKKEAAKWFSDFLNVLNKHNIGHSVWNYKQMDFEIKGSYSAP